MLITKRKEVEREEGGEKETKKFSVETLSFNQVKANLVDLRYIEDQQAEILRFTYLDIFPALRDFLFLLYRYNTLL